MAGAVGIFPPAAPASRGPLACIEAALKAAAHLSPSCASTGAPPAQPPHTAQRRWSDTLAAASRHLVNPASLFRPCSSYGRPSWTPRGYGDRVVAGHPQHPRRQGTLVSRLGAIVRSLGRVSGPVVPSTGNGATGFPSAPPHDVVDVTIRSPVSKCGRRDTNDVRQRRGRAVWGRNAVKVDESD